MKRPWHVVVLLLGAAGCSGQDADIARAERDCRALYEVALATCREFVAERREEWRVARESRDEEASDRVLERSSVRAFRERLPRAVDPWGKEYCFFGDGGMATTTDWEPTLGVQLMMATLRVVSAGPDRTLDTPDDIEVRRHPE